MAMTIEQRRAMALARARQRAGAEQAQQPAPQAPQSPPSSSPGFWGTVGDAAQSLGSGVVRGTAELGMLPQTVQRAVMRYGLNAGIGAGERLRAATGNPVGEAERDLRNQAIQQMDRSAFSGQDALRQGMDNVLHAPTTAAGRYMETVGEFLPGAVATGPLTAGGVVNSAIKFGVLPGMASEAAGQLTEGKSAEPLARLLAGIAAPAIPSVLRRVISPFGQALNPERAAQVGVLRGEGVNTLTGGQVSGSNTLRYWESELGGMAGARTAEQQGEQFTRAVLRRVGENASRASPEVIDRAFTRIGREFDDLASRNVVGVDNQLGQDLAAVQGDYHSLVGISQRAPLVDDAIDDIIISFAKNSGVMSGSTYQSMRSRLDRLARGNRADPQLADALYGLRNALDDAMERSLQQTNPADLGAWQEARRQYRNMLVIERAATGAGENAALGLISPSALRNAVVAQGRRAYARGQGDLAELARAGEAIMKPMPQSGTAPRMAARNIGTTASTALGGLAGGSIAGVTGAIAGGVAGSALPWLAGRALHLPGVRGYLGNQFLPRPGGDNPLLRALLNTPRAVPEIVVTPNSPSIDNRPRVAPAQP